MTAKRLYLLDSSILMRAAREYYAFDIAPAFWDELFNHATAKRVASVDKVKTEIEKGEDKLKTWVQEEFHAAFLPTDQKDIIECYGELQRWAATHERYTDEAKAEFADADIADAWLIACAKVKNATLVTGEVLKPNIKSNIPIPNVCRDFKINYCDTFEMMRDLGVQLT